jgi:hypothetical protein
MATSTAAVFALPLVIVLIAVVLVLVTGLLVTGLVVAGLVVTSFGVCLTVCRTLGGLTTFSSIVAMTAVTVISVSFSDCKPRRFNKGSSYPWS